MRAIIVRNKFLEKALQILILRQNLSLDYSLGLLSSPQSQLIPLPSYPPLFSDPDPHNFGSDRNSEADGCYSNLDFFMG